MSTKNVRICLVILVIAFIVGTIAVVKFERNQWIQNYTKDHDSILNMEYSPSFVNKAYDMWEDQTDEWKKNVGSIMIENGMAYMDEVLAHYFGIWNGYEENNNVQ